MRIERWEDHNQLVEGQLVTDAAGKLWKVHKYTSSRADGHVETWLCHFSDEYAFCMGVGYVGPDRPKVYALGDDAPFPLTTVKVVPQDDEPTRMSTMCVCGQNQRGLGVDARNVFAAHNDKAGDPCPGLPLPFPPTAQEEPC